MHTRGSRHTLINKAGEAVRSGTLEDVASFLDIQDYPQRQSGPRPKTPPESWRPWIDLFVAEQTAARHSAGTIRLRVYALVALAHTYPGCDPLTIGREHLIAYLGRDGLAPWYAKSLRVTLRTFFGMLYELGHRRDNLGGKLPKVRIPRSLPRPCPDHVVRNAFGAATDHRVRLALWIATETGLRRAEIVSIRRADVDNRAGDYWLHVRGKGGHERLVPLSDALAGALMTSPAEYVFPKANDGSRPISSDYLGRLVSRSMPDGWTAHTLRHRFATQAYAANNDLRAVQELLGHSSPTTTAIYTQVADNSLRAAATAARISFQDPLGA
jgi:integrase